MMDIDRADLYAALMHELKNNLSLLAMNIDGIPVVGQEAHDHQVDDARLLCQKVIDRLQQALLIYKATQQKLTPAIDVYSPMDLLHELRDTAVSLARGRLQVEVHVADDLPEIWFFDRTLIEMALINAIHNSLSYAKSVIRISAHRDAQNLIISVHDDSPGFPEHMLQSFATNQPYASTGTGLGLQFAQVIAQAHENEGRQGRLQLRNEHGAVFSLIVP